MTVTRDVAAERGVLAGICQYGTPMFLDITDFVKNNTFSVDANKVIFKCLEHIVAGEETVEKVDFPSIISASKELGLDHILERKEEAEHLRSIMSLHVEQKTVRRFAGKMRRLEIARMIHDQGGLLQEKMSEIDGTETITQLLGIAENVIFDFTALINDEDDLKPTLLGDGLTEYTQFLSDNPCQQTGISTGFTQLDESIGGGLHPGVAMVGARPKVGKTTMCINIGYNIASRNIPVLYLDTEMIEKGKYRDISNKLIASQAAVDINDVKTGQFSANPRNEEAVWGAVRSIENIPLYRLDIAGRPFEDILYAIRRWVTTVVGLNPDGTAKDCVVIYDYLKVMDTGSLNESNREFQLLGSMLTSLQNMGTRYAIPMLVFTQLNRDGIDNETSAVVAGSDRLTWFCTSLTIFKYKSREEIGQDGPELGNRKFVTIMSRYGPGHDFGEYCHVFMNKWKAQIREVTRENPGEVGEEFFVRDDDPDNDDQIPFD